MSTDRRTKAELLVAVADLQERVRVAEVAVEFLLRQNSELRGDQLPWQGWTSAGVERLKRALDETPPPRGMRGTVLSDGTAEVVDAEGVPMTEREVIAEIRAQASGVDPTLTFPRGGW